MCVYILITIYIYIYICLQQHQEERGEDALHHELVEPLVREDEAEDIRGPDAQALWQKMFLLGKLKEKRML